MRNFQESQDKVAIKTLSQLCAITGRLDAEYYQEKYDDISNVHFSNQIMRRLKNHTSKSNILKLY